MSPLSWNVAVKFLMARKFDVLRAIELFHSYRVRMGCGSWGHTPRVSPSVMLGVTLCPCRRRRGSRKAS